MNVARELLWLTFEAELLCFVEEQKNDDNNYEEDKKKNNTADYGCHRNWICCSIGRK